ncbi:hypothetical protein K439DRAFT_147775 [Ramaria rubella]|nr:hypothetical protein K439DRAFT_147775 [Ramaria rubella]
MRLLPALSLFLLHSFIPIIFPYISTSSILILISTLMSSQGHPNVSRPCQLSDCLGFRPSHSDGPVTGESRCVCGQLLNVHK